MKPQTCPLCGGRAKDAHPCPTCWRRHRRRVEALPSLDAELETTITRQDHLGQVSDIKARTVHGPLPYNPDASEVRTQLRATLVSWVRLSCDDYQQPYPSDTIEAMALHLADTRRARTHEAALEFHDEIRDLHHACLRAIDYPDERGRIKVGPCPEHGPDGEPCGGLLWAHLPREEVVFMRCDCCGREWSSIEWATLGRRIQHKVDRLQLARRWGAA